MWHLFHINSINTSPLCLFASLSPWVTRLAVWSAHLVPGQISHTCLIRWTLNHDCCAQSCMKHNPLSLTDTLYLPQNVSESVHVGHVSEWARRNGRLKMAVREREIKHMYVCTAQRIAGRHRKSMINMCLWVIMFVFCGPKHVYCRCRANLGHSFFVLLQSQSERNDHLIYWVSSSLHNQWLGLPCSQLLSVKESSKGQHVQKRNPNVVILR